MNGFEILWEVGLHPTLFSTTQDFTHDPTGLDAQVQNMPSQQWEYRRALDIGDQRLDFLHRLHLDRISDPSQEDAPLQFQLARMMGLVTGLGAVPVQVHRPRYDGVQDQVADVVAGLPAVEQRLGFFRPPRHYGSQRGDVEAHCLCRPLIAQIVLHRTKANVDAEHLFEDAGIPHVIQSGLAVITGQQLQDFLLQTLTRQGVDAVPVLLSRFQSSRIDTSAEHRLKAEHAQDAEIILTDTLFGITHEPDAEVLCVSNATIVIVNGAIGGQIESVESEVSTEGVLGPILGKRHYGAATIGLDIATQGSDLVRLMVPNHRHGAVLDACRFDMEPRFGENIHHDLGMNRGREIDVVNPAVHDGVADAAADQANAVRLVTLQNFNDLADTFTGKRERIDLHVSFLAGFPFSSTKICLNTPMRKTPKDLSESWEPTPQDFGFATDNPGGDWLKNKQKWAEKLADEHRHRGGMAEYMIAGAVTAHMGIKKPMYISPKVLLNLPGANQEERHRKPGDVKYDNLAKSVQDNGWKQQHAVMVRVSHKGRAFIMEGNTRVRIAAANGVRDVLVQFEWVNGGEIAEDDLWSPKRVAALCVTKPELAEKATGARPRDPRNNPNFVRWFKGSKVVNSDGSPRVMYHGTSQDFDTFDPTKIKAVDTDAPFNGFWFSSDHETSPAFHDPTNIMPVYLSIKNPAPWQVWRKVAQEVQRDRNDLPPRSRSNHDEVRHRLSEMGYDGIIFDQRPDIDAETLNATGRVDFRNVRGHKHWLEKSKQPELQMGKVKETYDEVVAELIRPDGSRERISPHISDLVVFLDDPTKVDFKQFDFKEMVGTIKLANGNTIVAKKEPREVEYERPVRTGREIDQIDLYDDFIGHITGYSDLEDFIESHSEETWVCFRPTQIKSVYNKGSWNPSNPVVTEEALHEGLIPVPPKMYSQALNFCAKEVIAWAWDRLRGHEKTYPIHFAELKRLAKRYLPEGLPKEPYGDGPVRGRRYRVNTQGMPDQYQEMSPAIEEWTLVIDWRASKNAGGWIPNKSYLVVYPMTFNWMRKYPERYNEESITSTLSEIQRVLEHELRHAVQFILLQNKSPEQVRQKSGYHDRTEKADSLIDYYTSPVEFDPTIGTSAGNFVELLKLSNETGKKVNVGTALRKYTAMTPTGMFDLFKADPFFKILRKKAPKKHAVAVRKIVAEIERLLGEDREKINERAGDDIPETEYGYWITDKGEFLVVPKFCHEEVAEQAGTYYTACFKNGWIRIVCRPQAGRGDLNVGFYAGKLGNRAISALGRLVNSRSYAQYMTEIAGIPHEAGLSGYGRYHDGREFLSSIARVNNHMHDYLNSK
jgi:hypothetical protein